jgi:hypothetical protein
MKLVNWKTQEKEETKQNKTETKGSPLHTHTKKA